MRIRLVSTALVLLATLCSLAQEAPPPLTLATGSGRTVFWRGETVVLGIAAATGPIGELDLSLARAHSTETTRLWHGTPPNGATRHFLYLPTDTLGGGDYQLTATAGGQRADLALAIRETVLPSPGMVIDDDTPMRISPLAGLAGLTAQVQYMSSSATGSRFSTSPEQLNAFYDDLTRHGMLHWIQDSTRPMSFSPPHSAPETQGEYTRRLVLMATALQRYPGFAGELFDYDPTGFYGDANHLVSYWRWGKLVDDLQAYMASQGKALHDTFRRETGLEPLTNAELMQLAGAIGAPEATGYIDMPTRRFAEEIAAHRPELTPGQLADLKQRAHAWFAYLMDMNRRRYADYLAALRQLDPSFANSTANTQGHNGLRTGHEYGSSYRGLDFRFLSVWNDQGGNPEYPFQTPYAALLLNQERTPEQPLWIDTVFGQGNNGHHFRESMMTVGLGAQGTGYSFEIGQSILGNGEAWSNRNDPRLQEVAFTAEVYRRYGDLFAKARFAPRVGILSSATQAHIRPWDQNFISGMFKLAYLLIHAGLPPAYVTEPMLRDGLKVDALIVLGQTEALSPELTASLQAFADGGGRILVDSATTVDWPFAERAPDLDLPFRDLGHPYNMGTAYNRHDGSVHTLQALAEDRCPKLRQLFFGIARREPLAAADPMVVISSLDAGDASIVVVTNDSRLDLADLFTRDQQQTGAYQKLLTGHGMGLVTSWVPRHVTLSASGVEHGAIYDLMTCRPCPVNTTHALPRIKADLASVPARLYAVYPQPPGPGILHPDRSCRAGETFKATYIAATPQGAYLRAVVPLEITLTDEHGAVKTRLWRATGRDGYLQLELPTSRFDTPGDWQLAVRPVFLDQQCQAGITVKTPEPLTSEPVPAATIRNLPRLNAFLRPAPAAEPPALVIPVWQPELRPLADKVAHALTRAGCAVRVWDDPPLVDYNFGYVVTPEQQPANDQVDRGDAFGTVLFKNHVHHVNGNFYGSSMTGYRFGRHVVLLGTPGSSQVLDGVLQSGMLWSDAASDAPGHGLVQYLPQLLGRNADTIVVTGADMDGLTAAVDLLAAQLSSSRGDADPVAAGVDATRRALLAQRGIHHLASAFVSNRPSERPTPTAKAPAPPALPGSVVAVNQIVPFGDSLLVGLARNASSLALVQPDGSARLLPSVTTGSRLTVGDQLAVCSSRSLAFAYNRRGDLVWHAIGDFQGFVPGTDDALIEVDKALFRVAPDGSSSRYEAEPPEPAKPLVVVAEHWSLNRGGKLTPYVPPHLKNQPEPDLTGCIWHIDIPVVQQNNRPTPGAPTVTFLPSGQQVEGLQLTARRLPRAKAYSIADALVVAPGNHRLLIHQLEGDKILAVVPGDSQARPLADATPPTFITGFAFAGDGVQAAIGCSDGSVLLVTTDKTDIPANAVPVGPFPRLCAMPGGRFAVGTGDGRLVVLNSDGTTHATVELASLSLAPSDNTAAIRRAPLLTWTNPPPAAGSIPLDTFYWYLRNGLGDLVLVNWRPQKAFDFRWFDAVQGELKFPAARTYKVTIKAAAKYYDEEPMSQPSWGAFVAMRQAAVKGIRPEPRFTLSVNGKPAGELRPVGGKLVPFTTPVIKEGWATLKPTDDQFTTFTGTVEAPAGPAMLAIEALGMTDCYATELTIE